MPRRWTRIARLPASDELAIGLPRGFGRYDFGSNAKRAFRQLREAAEGAGIHIPAVQSPCLGVYGTRLLAKLALCRRQSRATWADLDEAVRRCLPGGAARFDCAGARIACRNIAKVRMEGGAPTLQLIPVPPALQERHLLENGRAGRARILRIVRSRGDVSTGDVEHLGPSRQAISITFNRGLLNRLRFGVYPAAPEALAGQGATL